MDVVHAGVGDFSDVVLGDNGEVDFDTLTVPGTALVETVTSTATGLGGVDEIVTGDGADYRDCRCRVTGQLHLDQRW